MHVQNQLFCKSQLLYRQVSRSESKGFLSLYRIMNFSKLKEASFGIHHCFLNFEVKIFEKSKKPDRSNRCKSYAARNEDYPLGISLHGLTGETEKVLGLLTEHGDIIQDFGQKKGVT